MENDINTSNLFSYLCFSIQDRFGQNFGKVQIRVHNEFDIEKRKNPNLINQEAVDYFYTQHPEYKNINLFAIFTGDLIPKLNNL